MAIAAGLTSSNELASAQTSATPAKTLKQDLRLATFNVSLYGKKAGEIRARLARGDDKQAKKIAAIVQTVRPDILLVNEIDYDNESGVARLLNEAYFADGSTGRQPISYDYVTAFPSNTGIDSALDIDGDGDKGDANDAWGYGVYPGQYAMAVFSRFPIDEGSVRTFQKFRWQNLTRPLRPSDPNSGESYYSDDVWAKLRLSSKNHIDVPIQVGKTTIHLLASHPTPPVFDGPADHNGCRNHDEIQFWRDYISGKAATFVDDNGKRGGLAEDNSFFIAGDLNADPDFGDGRRDAIRGLLNHPRTTDAKPAGPGVGADKNAARTFNPNATASFGRNGLMRVDYVLPSSDMVVQQSGVFWPGRDSPARDWITASDHRLVWVDVANP